eukprot:3021391-Pleurochrysis_carterae.AAC.1
MSPLQVLQQKSSTAASAADDSVHVAAAAKKVLDVPAGCTLPYGACRFMARCKNRAKHVSRLLRRCKSTLQRWL